MWSENNVYFFNTVGYIAKVYIFLGHTSILTTQEPQLKIFSFLPVIFFPLIFTKNQKNSTIEALWGTVISPLPKKGTVQYSAKNTVPLDTLLKPKKWKGGRSHQFGCTTKSMWSASFCKIFPQKSANLDIFRQKRANLDNFPLMKVQNRGKLFNNFSAYRGKNNIF